MYHCLRSPYCVTFSKILDMPMIPYLRVHKPWMRNNPWLQATKGSNNHRMQVPWVVCGRFIGLISDVITEPVNGALALSLICKQTNKQTNPWYLYRVDLSTKLVTDSRVHPSHPSPFGWMLQQHVEYYFQGSWKMCLLHLFCFSHPFNKWQTNKQTNKQTMKNTNKNYW